MSSIEAAVDRAFTRHFDRVLRALQNLPSEIKELKRRVAELEKLAKLEKKRARN